MYIDEFRDYCIAKPGVTEETPFGPDTLVLKVMGKMFALTGLDHFEFINLKCEPEKSAELREQWEGIRPGWHMNKTHWNSVFVDGSVPDNMIRDLIDHSYELVASSLSKKLKEELKSL
ncbi:MmcQ/YjbR family DNA-binding protein [Roseivirga misakiensis]|uniref:MmcQ-like protein n=1 Tax=Roseivirga misakiensis TaxID=1563681 RepID=A0A1E5T1P8_9BACT|nr:MmcQ/YjbR family DNA-binding protein [Roseivirga misakiensis]OEK05286.1 MmcQ-like protein [Roseivirga misakiensis]